MKSYDAELAVVVGLMSDNSRIMDIDLLPDEFAFEETRQIYTAIQELAFQRIPADPITVAEFMEGRSGYTGWFERLGNFMQNTSSVNTKSYAKIIREKATRRRAAEIAHALAETAGEGQDAVDKAIHDLMEIGRTKRKYDYTISECLSGAIEDIEELNEKGSIPGVKTGIHPFDSYIGGLHDTDLVVVGARPSVGKELHADSKVLMKSGEWKRIADMNIGDVVAAIDNQRSVVTGVFPQGKKPLYRVKFADGRSILAGLDHQWEVKYRDWKSPRVITTSKLINMLGKKRYRKRLSIPLFSGDYGVDGDYPLHPWVVGALLGDGCMSEKKGGVHFSTNDEENIIKMNSLLPDGYSLKHTGNYDYAIVGSGKGRSSRVREILADLGIYGLLSVNKKIPDVYKNGSRNDRLTVLRGLMDTDGWVQNGSVMFCSASIGLANDVAYLVRSLGGRARIGKKENKSAGAYNVYIQHHNPKELFTLTRRVDAAKPYNTSAGKEAELRLTIDAVEYEKDDEAYCISVSHDRELYITDDFIVTHNTAFLLNCALGAQCSVGIISSEQGYRQVGSRVLAIEGRINAQYLRTPEKLDDSDYARMAGVIQRVSKESIFINDQPSPTIGDIMRQARQWKFRNGIKALYVDYIQRIKTEGDRPRHEQVGDITMKLKELARELEIPIMALAQVSRNVEQRTDKRPGMSDLKDSGTIEQEADVIATLYRDEVYNPDTTDKGIVEIGVRKNRHGVTGIIRAAWLAEYMRVEELAHGY